MRKAVKVIAIIATVGTIVYFIIACMQLANRDINWSTFLTTIISLVLNLILLWALHNALDRIEILEKEVFKINDKQRKIDLSKKVEEDNRPYRQCKECGAIVRTNEEKCPKCNSPYDDEQ